MEKREIGISICCVCNQALDDRQLGEQSPGAGFTQWMSLGSFLSLYRIPRHAYKLIETVCSLCSEKLGSIGRNQGRAQPVQPDSLWTDRR